MQKYVLQNRHVPAECGVIFAAFRGFSSPLRRTTAMASCRTGGHTVWWLVDADSEPAALDQLPPFVASRSAAFPVNEVRIP